MLAALRKSCDKYGLKLTLYFPGTGPDQGTLAPNGLIPGSPEWGNPIWSSGKNPDLKKEQLKELMTGYGPIAFFWMDHARVTAGRTSGNSRRMKGLQPDCFVGFNHGEPPAISPARMGSPGPSAMPTPQSTTRKPKAGTRLSRRRIHLPCRPTKAARNGSIPTETRSVVPSRQLFEDYKGCQVRKHLLH